MPISLGNLTNFGGKNILAGGNSGLDIATLISGLTQTKLIPANLIKDQITKGQQVASALGKFQGLLSAFKSAANAVRNPPGVGNAADNGFAYNSVALTSNTSVSATSYVAVSASPGALIQDFEISYISSLAKVTKQSSDTFLVADADADLVIATATNPGEIGAGTIIVNGATITLEAGNSLNEIASKFNNVANQTLINASVVKLDDGEFVLSFSGIVPGSANAFDLDSVGTVTSDPSGVLSQLNFTDNQLASDAIFQLDGLTVTRDTNVIDDLIVDSEGNAVVIQLLKVTPDDPLNPPTPPAEPTIITASVQADTQTAQDSIITLFNAYNDIRAFVAEQTELNTDGTYKDTAILATNSLFRTTIDNIAAEISAVVSGITGDDPSKLADIGISFIDPPVAVGAPQTKNAITVDNTTFAAAIISDYDAVRRLFEFDFSTDSTNLVVYKRTNALAVNEFTLDINPFATQVIDNLNIADTNTTAIVVASGATEDQFNAGPITVNGSTITLTAGMTLDQVASAFNTVSGTTGLAAAVTGSAGDYTLTFTATRQTGKANLFDLTATTQDAGNTVFGSVEITATGTFLATYDDGSGPETIALDGEAIPGGSGFSINGVEGTVLEGLELVFGAQTAEEADVTVTQGIGDRIYNILDGVLNSTDGTLLTEYESIQEKENNFQEQIEKIEDQVAKYQQTLIVTFTLLEQAISKVNQLLLTLDAYDKAKELANS